MKTKYGTEEKIEQAERDLQKRLERIDAHVIQPEEYEDAPELTEEQLVQAEIIPMTVRSDLYVALRDIGVEPAEAAIIADSQHPDLEAAIVAVARKLTVVLRALDQQPLL